MKLIHISDLHLGKRVNEMPMLADQEYALKQILEIAREQRADAMLVAGDVYDKTVPSLEAVGLLDWFLTQAADMGLPVFLISGNHDSAQRVAFGERMLQRSNIHISPVYAGEIQKISMMDAWGEVCFYLVPFLKPAMVRRFFSEREMDSYEEAFAAVLESLDLDEKKRNVILAHQFFAGASRCESEELSVGGVDAVPVSLLDTFDYAALGHLHRPQKLGRETVRYCGTPLKYSFSECADQKSVTVVELREKGETKVSLIPLKPLHDMREIRGSYQEITLLDYYKNTAVEDYLHITLTDEEDVPNALGKLRVIYPNLMKLDYDNRRTRAQEAPVQAGEAGEKSPVALFEELYRIQNNQELSLEQREYLQNAAEQIWSREE